MSIRPDSRGQELPLPHPSTPVGTAGGGPPGLDVSILVPTVQELFSSGLAASTQRAYRSGSNRYLTFCTKFKVSPFPVCERSLSFFVAFLYGEGLMAGTVKCYLSAVRHTQIALGLGDPHVSAMPQLEYVIKGLKKKTAGRSSRDRRPITPPILRQLKRVWESAADQFNAAMLWAASCMCFFGFLRSGEVVVPSDSGFDATVHLAYGDVKLDNVASPRYLVVQIKASKTDPFRKGVSIYLGRTDADLCPVAAVLSYMVQRGSSQGPFFRFSDGRSLTRDRFVAAVRSTLQAAGIPSAHYAGHSFRIGAATTAALCGVQDSLIKTLGRWESAAYTLYIRTPPETLCAVSRSLVSKTA